MAPMKGLTQFIVDLRNSKDLDEENKRINAEIINIQTKFLSSTNGYQKKKYVCKLIYIYLLGYTQEINFGLKESFSLLSSPNYSEKHLGYLAVSILLGRTSSTSVKQHLDTLLDSIHSYLLRDLESQNEDFNALAIQFIASNLNVLDSGSFTAASDSIFLPSEYTVKDSDDNAQQWLDIIDRVYMVCCSPIPNALLRKKAALTMLVLLKLYPDVILQNDNWVPRLLTLIDDSDLGVVLSSVPLVQFLVTLKPQYVKSIIPSVANTLFDLVLDNKCPKNYYYYETPAPWLTVKLLQLIEHFFLLTDNQSPVLLISDIDSTTLSHLQQVVARSIQSASQPIKGLPNRNSRSLILFQAVSLAVFLDASPEAIDGAIHALMLLLDLAETNTRYLALDALIKLTSRASSSASSTKASSAHFDEYTTRIFTLLNDKDVSVRKKALDLLYTICNSSNYNVIIPQMLDHFGRADLTIVSEIAVKVAILAEKFATDSTWYVTTMLRLLSVDTSHTSGVGAVGNEVWERIVQIIVNNESLQAKSCKLIISLLKKPLASKLGSLPENLIKVAAFVLGEYGHAVGGDDLLALQFDLLYMAYFRVALNTRAIILSTFLKFVLHAPDEDFVPNVFDLYEAETQSLDLEIQSRANEYLKLAKIALAHPGSPVVQAVLKPLPVFELKENPLMNRLGSVHKLVANRARSTSAVNVNNICDAPEEVKKPPVPARVSPNWYAGYHRMLHYDAGIFYESQFVKITYRIVKSGASYVIKFTIINNAAKTVGSEITGFSVLELKSMAKHEDPNYIVNLLQLPEATIKDKTAMEVEVKVRNVVENNESPIIQFNFKCSGSFNQLNLKFPTTLLKTVTPTAVSLDDYKKRWLQIGELLGSEGEFKQSVATTHRYNSSNVVRLLSRLGFSVVHSTPDTDDGILVMGAGILHTVKSNYGALATVKSVDHIGKEFELVVRCTGGGVAEIIVQTLREIFDGKF